MEDWASKTSITSGILGVLFADVSGWTDLCSRRGDHAALELRDALFGPLGDIVQAHRGRIVKTIGDELMCLFDSAQDAARAATDMQRHAGRANQGAQEPLRLRIGMHAGNVVLKNNDIEGDTVNTAARVAAASKPERILMTPSAAERLPEDLSSLVRPWRIEILKGKEAAIELFELDWRERDRVLPGPALTITGSSGSAQENPSRRVTLRCQGKECTLEPGGRPLTFGRSAHNALVIEDPTSFVSGSHGKIEIRGGNVVLTDDSRNGIYIAFGSGQAFQVNKTVMLRSSGRMALGRPPTDPESIVAEFDLR